MAKKRASKASSRKGRTKAVSRKFSAAVKPEVKEFLLLMLDDKKIQARFKVANINLLQIARGLGYHLTKKELVDGLREMIPQPELPPPNTCTVPVQD
jgi:hypothetical protein